MGGALGQVFATPFDPKLTTINFDIDRDLRKLAAFSAIYDTYRDAAMRPYFGRGGKFIVIHGTADGIFAATESMEYFDRLTQAHGGHNNAARHARLFLVPGMNHCVGGPATDRMDAIAAIVDWVEQGRAPGKIIAQALPDNPWFANRSRPLCPYPSYARYLGRGDSERAENFECTRPQ
jgi:Tannase and feruloyl esterase